MKVMHPLNAVAAMNESCALFVKMNLKGNIILMYSRVRREGGFQPPPEPEKIIVEKRCYFRCFYF